MNKIGIIQGRLSPRPYPKLQMFPKHTWKEEFSIAKEIGYDYIEWIFELDEYQMNPIWTEQGRTEIRRIVASTNIPVESVCADYFLERPFYRENGYTFHENLRLLKDLIEKAAEIGARTILLPVLETAELRTRAEEDVLISALEECVPLLNRCNIYLGLETELEAHRYKAICQRVHSARIGAYYDTGNCAACGFDMAEDMKIIGEELICVHVKDRKKHGSSVFLGTGDTNLAGGFASLRNQAYKGNFTLQTYFENDYVTTAKDNLKYIKAQLRE